MKQTHLLQAAVLVSVVQTFFTLSVLAQQKQDMTVEWMYSDTANMISTVPFHAWLENGTILLLDTQKPETEQIFELLDPRSGTRKPALDMKKALASLKGFFAENHAPSTFTWPSSLDATGRHGVYVFDGDVFVLDLGTAKFQWITHTDSEEKAATISPDGNHVAFVRDNDLYVYDLQQNKEQRITRNGSDSLLNGTFSWVYWEEVFGHQEAAYWWSPDSRSIAFLHTDESPVSTMYFVDFQPYQPRVIKQRYPKAGQSNPIVTLGIANISTDEITWMRLPSTSYEYLVRVNWLPSSDKVSIQTMNRAQTEVNLYFVDRSNGIVTNILKETDDEWVHHYDPYFLKNAKSFIWISERSGYAHLYLYTMDGQLINQITKGEWSLQPYGAFSIGYESPILAVNETDGLVFFTASEKSAQEKHVYRSCLDGTGFRRLSQDDGSHTAYFSPDAQYYLDKYANCSTPPELSLHRADGTRLQTVSNPRNDLLTSFDIQYPAFFTIRADDGFLLPAQLSKPKDFDPTRRYPVIIYVYGGPGAPSVKNSWNSNWWSESIYFDQILLDQGFLVMSVDNRSSAYRGKKFEKSIKGQMYGDVELHDLVSALRWLKAQSFVDPGRVGIWGWSGGGTYTLLAMTHTKEFKAGISVAPVTDWHYYDTKWVELIMKQPQDNADGYRKTSLIKDAANLHGRLLMVYGTNDDNVHPQNSQAFMNELIKVGILFEVMVYPMRKHTIDDDPARIHLYKTMLEFWKRNL
ncbi:MAG: S9 family peptidase [Bacteroidota bacterium]|jgi:dipeptidyl-peptidase-4